MKRLLAIPLSLFVALFPVLPVLGCIGPGEKAEFDAAAAEVAAPVQAAADDAGAEARAAMEALLAATTDAELAAATARLEAATEKLAAADAARAAAEEALAEKDRELREANAKGFLDVASTFWPQLAILAPVVTGGAGLFSKRWREHAGKALKSMIPTDGRVDVGGALVSMARAYGFAHTSKNPNELAAVASKLLAGQATMTPAEKADLLAKLEAMRAAATEKPVVEKAA